MSNTGFKNPGTIVDDDSTGVTVWNDPSNAGTSDDAYAVANINTGVNAYTHYLKSTNFGFSIPVGSTIEGVEATIERKSQLSGANYARDTIVKLVKGGTISGDNKNSATVYPLTDTIETYGGSTDMWGLTLTPADINASNFGVVLATNTVHGSYAISVDNVQIKVYYTPPPAIKGGSGAVGGNYVAQTYVAGHPKLAQIFSETFSDAIAFVDTKIARPIKTFAETIGLIDSFSKVGSFVRSLTDTLGVTDTKTSRVSTTKADSLSISDSHTSVLNIIRTFSDNIGLTDTIKKFSSKVAFVESIVLVDIQTVTKVFVLILQDIVALSEQFSTGLHKFFSQLFVDAVSLTESWNRKLDKLLSFVDGLYLTEIINKILPHKTFSDAIGLSDTVSKQTGKSFTESLSVIDGFIKGIIKNLSETLSLTDSIVSIKQKIREFVDGLSLSDSLSIAKTLKKVFTEMVTFSDNIFKSIGRSVIDAIGIVDVKILQPIKNFTESIHLSESIVKSVNILIADTVRLVDSIVRRWNGMIINWDKVVSGIGDWIKRSRKEDTTTKIVKKVDDWTATTKKEDTYTSISKKESIWSKFRGINDHE